ncbi:MAG: hypothetical protein QOE11_1690, partial [Solirubrobacteraceae bacterium]|nr:hypothetical protein [Solirubrobacteraceae bacterium]
SAVGPALGGFLTEAFSWQAMFVLQAPVALVALLALRGAAGSGAAPAAGGDRPALAPLIALALASAALSAALFLLVIMLIEGWRHTPGEAALTVTVMPIAALAAGGWARSRSRQGLAPALAGCVLVAGGLAALGLLPRAHAVWTLVPQLAIGLGLGLALATLIRATVGVEGAVARPAAWTVCARHIGIVIGLLVLTPLFTADLQNVAGPGERAGLARVLDAPLGLGAKIAVARSLGGQIDRSSKQLPDVDRAFAEARVPASERPAAGRLRAGLDDELDRAATKAFSRSFLAAALIALLAAGAVALAGRRDPARPRGEPSTNGSPLASGSPPAVALPAAAALAALLVAVYVLLGGGGYGPTALRDPCAPRARPAVDRTQLVALAALDGTACKLHVTREELARGLLAGRAPAGVSDDELAGALGAGLDRAQAEGALGGLAATVLRATLKVGGALGLIGLLLRGS